MCAQTVIVVLDAHQNVSFETIRGEIAANGEISFVAAKFPETLSDVSDSPHNYARRTPDHHGKRAAGTEAAESIAAICKREGGFLHHEALGNGRIQAYLRRL